MSKWSEKNGLDFISLNESLKRQTGIDFEERLSDFAKNEKLTEINVHQFIKEHYPVRVLTKKDNHNLSLLVKYYLRKVDEHDELVKNSAITYGCCHPSSTSWDSSFRSRYIRHLFPRPDQLQLCVDVVGFFPES